MLTSKNSNLILALGLALIFGLTIYALATVLVAQGAQSVQGMVTNIVILDPGEALPPPASLVGAGNGGQMAATAQPGVSAMLEVELDDGRKQTLLLAAPAAGPALDAKHQQLYELIQQLEPGDWIEAQVSYTAEGSKIEALKLLKPKKRS